jgi:hypothetical protein
MAAVLLVLGLGQGDIMPRIALLIATLLATSASAQTVIVKCVDARGNITYTTDACEPGQSVKDVKQYAPVHDDPMARARLQEIERQQDARNRMAREYSPPRVLRSAPLPSERDRKKARCAEARQRANEARGKGYDSSTLIGLDKQAVDACFGL